MTQKRFAFSVCVLYFPFIKVHVPFMYLCYHERKNRLIFESLTFTGTKFHNQSKKNSSARMNFFLRQLFLICVV